MKHLAGVILLLFTVVALPSCVSNQSDIVERFRRAGFEGEAGPNVAPKPIGAIGGFSYEGHFTYMSEILMQRYFRIDFYKWRGPSDSSNHPPTNGVWSMYVHYPIGPAIDGGGDRKLLEVFRSL